ncbi:prepilin peptidase [Vibrio mediterranei]
MEWITNLINDTVSLFNESAGYRSFIMAMLGALVGSFINVVVYRTPLIMADNALVDSHLFHPELITEPIVIKNLTHQTLGGRSITPCCRTKIKALHLVPILSWVLLRGKCAYCGNSISFRYLLGEVTLSVSFALLAIYSDNTFQLLWLCATTTALFAIARIDHRTQLIPDSLNLIVASLSLIAVHYGETNHSFGAALLYGASMYIFLHCADTLNSTGNGNITIGGGDIKLLSALTICLSESALYVGLLAMITAFIVTKAKRVQSGTYIALGPYICITSIAFLIIQPPM